MTTSDAEGPTARTRGPRSRLWLNILAVALAAAALAAAVIVPRSGSPGHVVAEASRGGPVTIGTNCTHYPGAEVTIQLPGPGTVVVSATVGIGIGHQFGVDDEARISLAGSPGDCTLDNYTAFVSVPATLPTDPYHFETVPLLRSFHVSAAGSYTVYVNAVMARGYDPRDRFDSASLVAEFYPR